MVFKNASEDDQNYCSISNKSEYFISKMPRIQELIFSILIIPNKEPLIFLPKPIKFCKVNLLIIPKNSSDISVKFEEESSKMSEYTKENGKVRGKSLPHDAANHQERYSKGNQLDELDKVPSFFFETRKTSTNNNRSLSQQKPLPESFNLRADLQKKDEGDNSSICIDDITEEGLDDWIAQSSNRNITSYLDPHRQFKAPISLVSQLRKRYKVKTKIDYSEQKKLYFSNNEEKTNIKCSDLFQAPKQRVRNPIELTFDHNNLSPKSLAGTSIRLREAKLFSQQDQINNVTSNSSSPYKTKRQPQYNLEYLSPEKLQFPDYKRDIETDRNGPKVLKEMFPLQQTLKDHSGQRNYNISGKNTMSLQEVIDSLKQRSKSIQYQISPSPKKRRQDTCSQSPEESHQNIKSYQLNKQANTIQIKLPLIRINDIQQSNNEASIYLNQALPNTPINLPSKPNFFTTTIDESETPSNNCKQKLSPLCRSPRNSKVLQSSPILEKVLMKKIIDKVEKLLEEKEETFRVNDQEKVDSAACSFEENYRQNMDELDIEIARGGLKAQQDSVTASYLKGVGRMKKNKDKNAVAAFKQALTFEKAHFPSIYGLACIYERNKMLKIAEQWLEIGALFGQSTPQINYGFALIYYKQHRYEEALKKIEFLISEACEANNNSPEDREKIRQSYLYLRSLCAKKLGQKISDANRQSIKDEEGASKGSFNKTPSKRMQKQLIRKEIASKSLEKSNKQSVSESKNEISEFQAECSLAMSTPTSEEYYNKASSDYKAFVKYTCPKNFNLLKTLMFAIVFKKIRKMEIKFPPHIFCEFISLVNQILAADSYTPTLEPIISGQFITSIQRPIRQRSLTKRKLETSLETKSITLFSFESKRQDIVDTISNLSFFNRFQKSTIEKVLPYLQLRYLPKTEILFAKKGEVFIIIAGHLTVFDHQKQFNSPEIVAYYTEGDIIGCEDKDNKISFHPDIWFLSLSRVEYLVMPESEFTNLWNIQNSLALKTNLNFIQSIDLFERTSQLLQYRLAFELLVEKTFKEGDIVFNDGESVNKYNYIELIKEDPRAIKNLRNRISNKITYLPLMHQNIQGFYLVQGGSLKLLTLGNWQEYSLNPFNYVGENLLFPTLSISRFGQIVCQTPISKCLFLSQYHFHKINSLDKEIMRLKVLGSEYYANCQKILFKFYKHHKVNNFDLPIQSISN